MWTFVLVGVALYGLYYFLAVRPFQYWTKNGVVQLPRPVPIFGHNWETLFKVDTFESWFVKSYNTHPNSRYVGCYQLQTPTLIIKDPEVIKNVLVKDFDHFVDHRAFIPEDVDPLFSGNLISLKGQKWRDMRATLSPSFTASKMKTMFVLMNECSKNFVAYFKKMDKDVIELDMKDTFSRYTNDIIASCAFGVKCNSVEDKQNEFFLMGKEATDFVSLWKILRIITFMSFPFLGKLFGFQLFSKNVSNFFTKLVTETISLREKNNTVRPDMIQLLMEARNPTASKKTFTEDSSKTETKAQLTDLDIVAQALLFFFAGFDTVSDMMSFVAYELGANPDIQQRLYEEMCDVKDICGEELTYDAVMNKMPYLDMVISESMRKWPAPMESDRLVTKPYTIEPTTKDEKPVHLEKGFQIRIPIFAIQRDPKYYPNPDKFDPERFNEENKKSINPYTYLPFGLGPRSCIGNRFALLEAKAAFYHLLTNFEIVPTAKTTIPLKLAKGVKVMAEGGMWFGLKRRNN